ncbi:hypothetical protein ScPMuIL_013353 [Solemya velum]
MLTRSQPHTHYRKFSHLCHIQARTLVCIYTHHHRDRLCCKQRSSLYSLALSITRITVSYPIYATYRRVLVCADTHIITGTGFVASNGGVEVACEGICPCPCDCPKNIAQVCTALNNVYDNYCLAQCAGEEVVCGGTCPCEPWICIALYDPVCDVTGKTHSNACNAACSGIPVACDTACPCVERLICRCTKEYVPVCGTDGKTYTNAWQADCASTSRPTLDNISSVGTPPSSPYMSPSDILDLVKHFYYSPCPTIDPAI